MDNNILLLKLNRVVWVGFLEQKKIEEAIRFFEMYILNFESLKNHKELKEIALNEIKFSIDLFLNKIELLANDYFKNKDWANAAICYTAYFKYKNDNITVIRNLIETLDYLKQYDLEIDLLLHLEANIKIKDANMYKLIAELQSKRKNYRKAIEIFKKYMEISKSTSAQDYNILGCYYNLEFSDVSHNIEDAKAGLDAFNKASDAATYSKLFAKNGTVMAGKVGDNILGQKFWNRVIKAGNLTNDDKYDYAAFCLKNKDFKNWKKYFDARFDKENNKTQFPKINKPKWNGKNIPNSTLLVYFEQGFGDTFLMYGYLPRLTKLAKHVIFVVQDTTAKLFQNNDYGIEVIPACSADLKSLKFDYYIPSMSIPIIMDMEIENISVGEGYIKADKKLVKEYKEKYFKNNNLKIGISVSGNNTGDRSRDIRINSLLPFDELKNIEIYCLTKGIADSEFDEFKKVKINNLGKNFDDFSQTAAAIENCDIVISTDNCILNLAGGLGKKTFGLFNNPNQFRWFDLTGENTVWLTSVKPFVNEEFNKWAPTIEKVINEVKKLSK